MKLRCLNIFAGSPRRAIFAASSSNDVRQSPRKSSTNYYASPLMLARQDGMKITYVLFIYLYMFSMFRLFCTFSSEFQLKRYEYLI